MNEVLRVRIRAAREALRKDPHGILAGKLPEGAAVEVEQGEPGLRMHAEFLAETNGPTLGVFDFWSDEELSSRQYVTADCPGGGSRWLCVGQFLYEPICLDRSSGEVRLFGPESELGPSAGFGELDGLLLEHVFGSGYAKITPGAEDDEWYRLLRRLGFAS